MQNGENIKISVIIPFYNAQEYLKKCLETVVNQTVKEIEIILIDDASCDDSIQMAQDFAKTDSRIKILTNEKNKGQGYSRNLAVEQAKGKYVAFVDADDWLELNMYEELFKKAENTDADIAKCQFYHVYSDQKEKYRYTGLIQDYDKVYKYSDNPLVLLGQSVSVVWNGMYKREFLLNKALKFNEKIKYEDTLFHWQAFIEAEKIVFTDEYLYFYNRSNEGSDTAKIKKYYYFILENLKLIKKYILEKNLQKELTNAYILKCFIFYNFQLAPALNSFAIKKVHKNMLELLKDFDNSRLEEIFKQNLASRLGLLRFLSGKNNKIQRTIQLLKRTFFF